MNDFKLIKNYCIKYLSLYARLKEPDDETVLMFFDLMSMKE